MKPFDPNKPVKTRSGREAIIVATDMGDPCNLLVKVKTDNGSWGHMRTRCNGAYSLSAPSEWDLINIPEKRTVDFWVNVYPDTCPLECILHRTKESADSLQRQDRIACLHITKEYIEGEGL